MSRTTVVEPADSVELAEPDLQLLRLIADGLVIEAIARRVDVSERTVRRRVRGICDRLGVQAPVQAAVWAARAGTL